MSAMWFSDQLPPPALYFEVNTFREGREEIDSWLDQMRELLVDPVAQAWRAKGTPVVINLDTQAVDGEPSSLRYSDEAWTAAKSDFQHARLRELRYVVHLRETAEIDPARVAFVNVTLGEDADIAHSLSVLVSRVLYDEQVPQADWIDAISRTAYKFDASTGYLTVDHVSRESPYEQSVGRWWIDGLRESRELLRGYYWGNVLSSLHIATLGGLDRIKAEAPCYQTSQLAKDVCFLQLTVDIEDISDGALARLKGYLNPLLPAREDDFEYVGPPLRL